MSKKIPLVVRVDEDFNALCGVDCPFSDYDHCNLFGSDLNRHVANGKDVTLFRCIDCLALEDE